VIRQIKSLQFFWTVYFVEFANSALGIMETVELRQPSLPKSPGAASSGSRPFRKLKNEDRILSL
jgi:hypothetical protein